MSKVKDAALSSEMLAAGLAAAGTAVASSPKARRVLYEAGVEVADEAGEAANRVMKSTAKFAALIGEAVADAVQRALSGDLLTPDKERKTKKTASSTGPKKRVMGERQTRKRKAGGRSNTSKRTSKPG